MQGILLVDKPKTWTSFDAVNFVRSMVARQQGTKPKNTKVGHCGTLDPLATGLLILVVGKEYTRRAGEFTKLDKVYDVTLKLGQTSTTGDEEGEKATVSDDKPSLEAIKSALQKFSGDIMQVPPQFSAMKINGQRAYTLARAGKAVELEARPVTVHDNTFVSYEYPLVRFTSHVSSGTYIRSLVEDIGVELATGAYMSDLRRTHISSWDVADATLVSDLTDELLPTKLITL